MKIKYEFVTGETVEIEVSDEWGKQLIDMNRKDYNEEKKETRRHYKLDTSKEGSGCLTDQRANIEDIAISDLSADEICIWARRNLTKKQFDAFVSVCITGLTAVEYAKKTGTTHQAVYKNIVAAKRKLKKYLKQVAF